MTIEIKKPELQAAIQERLQSGAFHDVDELLTKALAALPSQTVSTVDEKPRKRLVDILSAPAFAGSGLEIERLRDYPRSVDL